jgi:opacity protein-like surface antigen
MKNPYFSSGVCLALCLGITTAGAQTYREGAGPYFRVEMGPSFFQDGEVSQFGSQPSATVNYKTGIATDAAIGFAFNKYLATDFEFGAISAEINSASGYSSSSSFLYNFPFLANFTLSYPIRGTIVTPYIGAGAGGSSVVFDTDNFYNYNTGYGVYGNETDTVFAWQAFAGLRFKLNHRMSLGVGYKYFTTGDSTFNYPLYNGADVPVTFKGVKSSSVLVTFQMTF